MADHRITVSLTLDELNTIRAALVLAEQMVTLKGSSPNAIDKCLALLDRLPTLEVASNG